MMYFVVRPEGARSEQKPEAAVNPLPRVRDRMITAEYDLSEFARLHTGSSSWSAEPELDDPRRHDLVSIVDVRDEDEDLSPIVDDREAYVLSLLAPQATVADVLDMAGMPASEVFAILGSLAQRGIVKLSKSTPTPSTRIAVVKPADSR